MNSRQLWNSRQRHKFLRAEAFRDTLKFRVSEMAFLGGFRDRPFDDFRSQSPPPSPASHPMSSFSKQIWFLSGPPSKSLQGFQ